MTKDHLFPLAAALERHTANGFNDLEPYVSRLLEPSNEFKFLNLYTLDGTRGFGFDAKDGVVHVGLTVHREQEPYRETAIRAFWSTLGVEPSQDHLASDGVVPDALRLLDYPVTGSASEVTVLAKRILQELCGVSPTELLDIRYGDK